MKIDGNVVTLTGNEVATAIEAYLVARRVCIVGPRTIRIGEVTPTLGATVYVDASGRVVDNRTMRKH